MKSSGPARARCGALAAVAALLALAGTAGAGPGRHRADGRRSASRDPQRTPSGAAAPARARGMGRTGVGTAVVGGPELAGRGVIVHYPASGARRLPSVHASSYVIADAGTGQVLAAKDPHGHFLPASTLKVLTADALMPAAEAGRHRGDLRAGRGRDPEQGRPGQGPLVPGVRPVPGPAADFRQRRGDRPRPGDRVVRPGRGHDERRGAPAPGRRHRGQAAERAERQGPAHLRLRPGPVRPAGADHAGVHADRGHPDRDVPAASPPLDRVVQPEHDAQHLPWRPRRQNRLDQGVQDHVHRLGPAERPHADRDPHALRPAHRDDRRRQAAELGLRHGWEGHPGRHAGPAPGRRGGRPGGHAPGDHAPATGGSQGGPGPRSAAAQHPGHQVTGTPGDQTPAASRSVRLAQVAGFPTISWTAGIGALVLAALVAGGIVVLLRRRPGGGSPPGR